MINEREEFLSYINFPEYISHSKQDYGYLGNTTFTSKLLATIPKDILIRSTSNHGVNRYKIMPEFLP